MFVTNTTGQYIYVTGYALVPGESVEIPNEIYLGQETLKEQINQLYNEDRIHVSFSEDDSSLDFPVLDNQPEIPDNFYIDKNSIEVQSGDVTSILGIEQTESGDSFGIIELHSAIDSAIKLKAYCDDDSSGSIHVKKESGDLGKPFKVEIEGMEVTLDSATATTSDIVDALITLGLVAAP
jgi:hypothetical protein